MNAAPIPPAAGTTDTSGTTAGRTAARTRKRTVRWLSATAASGTLAAGVLTLAPNIAQADQQGASPSQSAIQADFAAAAKKTGVPESVLVAVANQESGLQSHPGYSQDAGWGPMDLRDVTPEMLEKGPSGIQSSSDLTSAKAHPELHTLLKASKLTGIPADDLRHNVRDNILGGAKLLAFYHDQVTGGKTSGDASDPSKWTDAVAAYSQMPDEESAQSFTNDVFASIRSGLRKHVSGGQSVDVPADPSAKPAAGHWDKLTQLGMVKKSKAGPTTPAECPKSLDCTFVQASSTGVQVSNRPADGVRIDQIVLHTTEGSYDSAIQELQGPNATAAHYVMRASDGAVTQMVSDKDVAFANGNYPSNLHSINIETEGFSAFGAKWYTDIVYKNTAKLVKYLADRYDIPLDRQHIIGHDNVPGVSDGSLATQHWDRGPFWDWTRFMKKIDAPFDDKPHGVGPVGSVVTIAPPFRKNKQTFTISPVDDPTGDTTAPTTVTEPANSLFVHQEPSADSPLILDKAVHPDAGQGTNDVDDWSTTVEAGQHFVVAGKQGDWTAIWFSGQKGWIENPDGENTIPTKGVTVLRSADDSTAPVYGTDFPDPSEVPAEWGPDAQNVLTAPDYGIPAGQAYVADQPATHAQDFFPSRQAVVTGTEKYYTFQFNHRYLFVNADDVTATKS